MVLVRNYESLFYPFNLRFTIFWCQSGRCTSNRCGQLCTVLWQAFCYMKIKNEEGQRSLVASRSTDPKASSFAIRAHYHETKTHKRERKLTQGMLSSLNSNIYRALLQMSRSTTVAQQKLVFKLKSKDFIKHQRRLSLKKSYPSGTFQQFHQKQKYTSAHYTYNSPKPLL